MPDISILLLLFLCALVKAMPVPGESAIFLWQRWTVMGHYDDDDDQAFAFDPDTGKIMPYDQVD